MRDEQAIQQIRHQANDALESDPGLTIHVTVVGEIEALLFSELRVATNPYSGKPITKGYGHVGRFPAQILVKTMKDLEIKP